MCLWCPFHDTLNLRWGQRAQVRKMQHFAVREEPSQNDVLQYACSTTKMKLTRG